MTLNKIVFFDIDYTLFDTDTYKKTGLQTYQLFQEVKEVLERVLKCAEIGILSEGQEDIQREKLRKTGIEHLFNKNNVHITQSKKDFMKSILNNYKDRNIVLIDDRKDMLLIGKELYPSLITIWIRRGIYQDMKTEEEFSPDYSFESLKEVSSVICMG